MSKTDFESLEWDNVTYLAKLVPTYEVDMSAERWAAVRGILEDRMRDMADEDEAAALCDDISDIDDGMENVGLTWCKKTDSYVVQDAEEAK